jgi:hypothetical protein
MSAAVPPLLPYVFTVGIMGNLTFSVQHIRSRFSLSLVTPAARIDSYTGSISKTTNCSEQSTEPGKHLYINVNTINQQKERHPGAYKYQLIQQLTWTQERETSKKV